MPGHFLAAITQYPDLACDGLIGWGNLFFSYLSGERCYSRILSGRL